jgi:hypothetical protein
MKKYTNIGALRSLAVAGAAIIVALHGPAQAAVIHQYELNGSFADTLGGPNLIPNGGTLSVTSYDFGANQGLSLSNALPTNDHYSILIDFTFSDVSGYRKVIDFSNLASDIGLYVLSQDLYFYPVVGGSGQPFASNVPTQLVLTRDGTSDEVVGYVNGLSVFTFTDSGDLAVFGDPNSTIQFFNDDYTTSGGEASAGSVDRISIYDAPLSAVEVANIGVSSVPEPSGLLTLAALIASGSSLRRRSKKTA